MIAHRKIEIDTVFEEHRPRGDLRLALQQEYTGPGTKRETDKQNKPSGLILKTGERLLPSSISY